MAASPWVARPSDRAYLLFGVILLLHAASSVSAVPVNAGYEFWVRMASFLRIFAGAMAFPFLCLLVGRRPIRALWVSDARPFRLSSKSTALALALRCWAYDTAPRCPCASSGWQHEGVQP